MSAARKKNFWQLLVEEGLVTPGMLKEAARRVKSEGGRMEEHLVVLGLDDTAFARFVASRFRVPFTELVEPPDPAVLALVPREVARQFDFVPFAFSGGKVFVAFANPLVEEAYLELDRVVGAGVVPYVAPLRRIRAVLEQYPETPPEGLASRFSVHSEWGEVVGETWKHLADLPAQQEARKSLESLRAQVPRIVWLRGPEGSGRTTLALAWGQAVEPGGVRWARGKAMEARFERMKRKGMGDTLVEVLAMPPLLVVDDPSTEELWSQVLEERLQRGGITVVVTGEKASILSEILGRAIRVGVDKPGEEDARVLAEHRKAALEDRTVQMLWKTARGHLGRFSALLDSLRAAVGGDWSRVSPDLVKRLAT